MNHRWRAALLLLVAVPIALVSAVSSRATPIDQKKEEARQVIQRIQELNYNLSAADEKINKANYDLEQVLSQQKTNRFELTVAKQNLVRSQAMIAKRLVSLYTQGETSSLQVLIDATSLTDVIRQGDNADALASVDKRVIEQVKTYKAAIIEHAKQLAHQKDAVARILAERRAQRQSIADQLAERQRLLTSIHTDIQHLEAQEAARAAAAARAAQAAIAAAQARQVLSVQTSVVGASATLPSDSGSSSGGGVIPSSPYGSRAVSVAMQYLGVPYVWGGSSPGGFDCSGLVMYSYAQIGVSLPRVTYSMWNVGVPVPFDQLEPGDLVFFHSLGHMGMYIGGGQYINAPYTGANVRIEALAGYHLSSYDGARRIL